MQQRDITDELWREYDFGGRVYRIDSPKALVVGTTTHRVVGSDGLVHCVPAPGLQGCVLRWQPRDPTKPIQF